MKHVKLEEVKSGGGLMKSYFFKKEYLNPRIGGGKGKEGVYECVQLSHEGGRVKNEDRLSR